MKQFLVPQFIEVEPRVIGPVTVRQFIISLVGTGLIFLAYKFFDFWTFIVSAVILFAIFGTVAFLKINGRPFHFFLLNLIETWRRPTIRTWSKVLSLAEVKQLARADQPIAVVAAKPGKRLMSSSHLEELSLVVNTGGAYKPVYDSE